MTVRTSSEALEHREAARLPAASSLHVPRRLTALAGVYAGDIAAGSVLLAVAVWFTLVLVRPVTQSIRGDWPTFFFPVYTHLGRRLRAFDLPDWNPHWLSGAPFAGDPQSGWGYLPAMGAYALLPAEAATVVYIGLHIMGAALALYAFARLLGLGVLGSFVGGAVFAFAWVAPGSMQLVLHIPLMVWCVVALIAVELAVRAAAWPGRLWSWLVGGLAISQIIAIWIGQAGYYVAVTIGAWLVFRTLLAPPQPGPWRWRLERLALTGLGLAAAGAGLSAASLLPRIDVVSRSILAGGVYDVVSALVDSEVGYSPPETLLEILGGYTGTQWWYVGAVGIALAVMAPVVAWRWAPLPFFALLAVVSLIMVSDQTTPLHRLLYALLPRFQGLHEHSPYRVLVLASPAVAMLAAATIAYLPQWTRSRGVLAAIALIPAVLALALAQAPILDHTLVSVESIVLVATASALVALYGLAATDRVRQATLAALLLLVLWDPAGRLLLRGFTQSHQLEMSIYDSLYQESAAFLYDNGAARFLADQQARQPGRYAGFDPALLPDPATIDTVTPYIGYRGWISHDNRGANRLLVFNWATWFELDDVQAYNPVHIRRYAEFIDAINGHRQEYHERDLFFGGLFSPLLDLLNLRYLVVPANAPERGDLARLTEVRPTLYVDDDVRVLEDPETLPRAWLVHEARQVAPGEALSLLADGGVDPRETALLEVAPPPLEEAPDPAAETAVYLEYLPDSVRVEVNVASPALLVLSEVWDPGWSATVNGEAAPVYVANHILRAVPVPAGEHVVELTYEAPFLRLGMAITLATAGALVAGALYFARRSGPGGQR